MYHFRVYMGKTTEQQRFDMILIFNNGHVLYLRRSLRRLFSAGRHWISKRSWLRLASTSSIVFVARVTTLVLLLPTQRACTFTAINRQWGRGGGLRRLTCSVHIPCRIRFAAICSLFHITFFLGTVTTLFAVLLTRPRLIVNHNGPCLLSVPSLVDSNL